MTTDRVCSFCGRTLPLESFLKRPSRCRDCRREYNHSYHATHPEQYKKHQRAWAERNRDSVNAWYRVDRAQHPARYHKYYLEHKEQRARNHAAWAKCHPDAVRDNEARRRARKKNAPAVERIDRALVFARDGGRCHICGRKVDPAHWHLDHLIALARGGSHTYNNVAVSHPTCNQRKYTNGPAQLRLDLRERDRRTFARLTAPVSDQRHLEGA